MKVCGTRDQVRLGLGLLLCLGLLSGVRAPARAQAAPAAQPPASPGSTGPQVLLVSTGHLPAASPVGIPAAVAGRPLRAIDDPCTGARWLLVRDGNNPAGPGRLLLVVEPRNAAGQGSSDGAMAARTTMAKLALLIPVIRAGDRLVVEEDTPRVEARLEAVALGPAAAGSGLEVRLRIGGRVVRAVALAPGRAAFAPETEVRP